MTKLLPVNSLDDEMDLRRLFGLFYARKLAIIVITVFASATGVAYALFSAPVYMADALVQLEEKSSGGLALSSELTDMLGGTAPQSVAEIEILKSRMILGSVIENLNLTQTAFPKRLPIIGDFLTRYTLPDPGWSFLSTYAWHGEEIILGDLNVPDYILDVPLVLTHLGSGEFMVDLNSGSILNGRVGVPLRDESTGFMLLVDYLAGDVGREFIILRKFSSDVLVDLRDSLSIHEKGKKSSILQLFLKNARPDVAARILDQIIKVYLRQNLSQNVAEAESSIAFIQQQIPEARSLVADAEAAINDFKQSQASVDLSFETRSLLENAVQFEASLNALELEEQELRKRFTPSHPVYQTLLDNRKQLQAQLEAIRMQTGDLPETQQEMLRLSQDLEVAREIYLQLISRGQELNVIKAGTLGNIRIIDAAQAQITSIAPNKKVIVLLSVILGGIAALGFVLMRSLMARGIETIEDIEQLGITVYASVAKVQNKKHLNTDQKGIRKILAKEDPTSMIVESLRSLRTSLHFNMLGSASSLLLVTSARPGEGKSFVSINLATVMAQAGQNVCIVDADIRRGYLRRFFGVEKNSKGLTDVLAGEALIEDVIQQDNDSGLYFIPSGRYPHDPSELLMNKAFEDALKYLDKRFDFAILDAPPILAVTDPVIMGKHAGTVLMVVHFQKTQLSELKAAQKILNANKIEISGALFNGYDPRVSTYGYVSSSYQYEYKSRKS